MSDATLKELVKELFKKTFHIIGSTPKADGEQHTKLDVLCDQLIDSAIVGGISALSAYLAGGEGATVKGAVIGFTLTFLIKMKEYRNIK